MIAASHGNDKLVRKYLNESLIIDVYPKFGINIESIILRCPLETRQSYDFSSCIRYDYIDEKSIMCNCSYCQEEIKKSALWLACFNGHLNVVQTLIEIGKIDIDDNGYGGFCWSFLSAAIINQHMDIIKYFIEEKNVTIFGSRELFMAIRSGNVDLVNYFLDEKYTSETYIWCSCKKN